MKSNSFCIFLNFLLFLIIVVGSIVVYQIGNFDGVSMNTLRTNYIDKKSLKFSDLSKSEQEKYINKNLIEKKSQSSIKFDNINFDENTMHSKDELNTEIRDLKNKFLIIQNDNLVLFNEKEKLKKLIAKFKNQLIEQKKQLISKSLEQINETEQQHYKNISELTARLNDLQRQNIELSQGNNEKVIELKNQIYALNKKITAIKDEENQNIDMRIFNEKKKNKTLGQTIVLMQKRVQLLQENIKNLNLHTKQLEDSKNIQISNLQDKNRQILNDKKILIEKNTQTIFDIEKKSNEGLKKINNEIAKLQNKNEKIKNSKEKDINKISNSYDMQILSFKEKIKSLNTNNLDLKSKISSMKESLNTNNINSNLSIKSLQQEKEKLLVKLNDLNSSYMREIEKFKSIKNNFSYQFEKNEKKHNENYKVLNEQIFRYETIIANLKKSKNEYTKKEDDKISEIRDAFNELNIDVKKRESDYGEKLKKLKYEIKERELFYAKKYKEMTPSKLKKLTLVGSVNCQDMPFGKAKATKKCKQKVDNFLTKYNASYYFKIVPIVDNGGFASLKKLDAEGNIMPKKEIKRLTSLANLGLGKYRAAEGGKLVKEKFKDFAKISYAPNNISVGKKRGFEIRVYK